MKHQSIVSALDIGSSKLSLTVATMDTLGTMNIIAHSSIKSRGVKSGTIQNIVRVVKELEKLKANVEEICGFTLYEISVNVGSPLIAHHWAQHTSFQSNSEGVFCQEDLQSMIGDVYQTILPSGHEILHVLPFYFELDNNILVKDPLGFCGNRMDGTFRVVSIDRKVLRAIKRCLELSGMKIDELLMQPISSAKSVVCQEEKELGVCVVDIGAGTTDISIFKENSLMHICSIPLGADLINSDLQKALALNNKQAEAIKCKLGHAIVDAEDESAILSVPPIKKGRDRWIPVINITLIIEARMTEIFEVVYQEILTTGLDIESGIVLTGGGSKLSQIDKLCEWICQMPTRIAVPNEAVDFGVFDYAKDGAFSAGIGLAYHSLSQKMIENKFSSDTIKKHWDKYKKLEEIAENFNTSKFYRRILQKLKVILLDDVRYEYPSK